MNLRAWCQIPDYPSVLLTTYNIDPLFFERVVLTDLVAGGARAIVVLADASQAIPAIERARGQLIALGRRYRLLPVHIGGSFHPKICLRVAGGGALVSCGSANLTRAGWLGCDEACTDAGNREVAVAWRVEPGTWAAALMRDVGSALMCLPEAEQMKTALEDVFRYDWIENAPPAEAAGWTWLVSGPASSLADQLAARWAGRTFERLYVVCGSTDQSAEMIRWAARVFGIRQATVEIDLEYCGFDPARLSDLPIELTLRPRAGSPRTHLKLALFESRDDAALVTGSANCSGSAWLRPMREAGNVEAVVIHDQIDPASLEALLDRSRTEAVSWREAGLSPPSFDAPSATVEPTSRQLRQLMLDRSSGGIEAVLEPQPPPEARLFFIAAGARVPLRSLNSPGRFRGPEPDLARTLDTEFGHVEIDIEGTVHKTNAMWIDDLDRLRECAEPRMRIDAITRLGRPGTSTAFRALLEDLRFLASTLLDAAADFADRPSAPRDRAVNDGRKHGVATAQELITSITELRARGESRTMSAAFGSPGSLAGILRAIFAETEDSDFEADDFDVTAEERRPSTEDIEKGIEEQGKLDAVSRQQTHRGGDVPDERDRRRLIKQLQRFVDELDSESFVKMCTARRLQQAAAFPLAVARCATRGAWAGPAERAALQGIVRRTCEILLRRSAQRRDRTSGRTIQRGPLIEEVHARYRSEGREEDFLHIIGDGVLWLAITAVLATLIDEGQGAGSVATFELLLLMRDVARCESLIVRGDAERLEPLAARLETEPRFAKFLERNGQAIAALDSLESYLSTWAAQFLSIDRGRHPRPGDWLWKPDTGFARIEELQNESGKARVHIRRRAETCADVHLKFYVNLRTAAEQDPELKTRLQACTAAVRGLRGSVVASVSAGP